MSKSKTDVLARLAKARGEEIRQEREKRGWSQAQLAEAAETTQQTVDRIERGVTGNSKALPKLRQALDLPDYDYAPPLPPDTRTQEEKDRDLAEIDRYIERTDKVLKVAEGTHLPVYAMKDGGQLITSTFADAIPRAYPVQNVKDAYGIISREYLMEPVIRPGDIVVVNPNLPPISESEIVLSRKDGEGFFVLLRSLLRETSTSWTVQTPLEGHAETLSKDEWPTAELIVAKISRVR